MTRISLLLALVACSPDAAPHRAEAPAEGGLQVHQLDPDGLADGVTIAASPFRSFAVVVTADPGTGFQYRYATDEGFSEWIDVTWDWSHGRYRNGHQVVPVSVEAVELRAHGETSFVQLETYAGEARVHDDDYPNGLPSSAKAVSGMWEPAYDAWLVAQGWYLGYEYATSCVGALLPGSAALGDFLVANYGASSYQGYNCRSIGGSSSLSVHSAGRAIDVFVPTDGGDADNGEGDPIAEFLITHAEEIGISYVIWDRASWGAHRSGDKHQSYSGVHPHHDHLHIELTSAGANLSTPWFVNGMSKEPELEGYVALAGRPSGDGYWIAHTDGRVHAYGAAVDHGDAEGWTLAGAVRDVVSTASGDGYWLVAEDGGVFSFGDAPFYGSMGGEALTAAVVGMAATPSGAGYWLVGEDGGVFSFGDAGFHGSTGAMTLNAPVVAMAPTPSGDGYWLVAEDGGVFSFGDAGFHGSTAGMALNAPVTGIASTSTGDGYWLFAEDGGIFAFGDAAFHGSMGGVTMNAIVTDGAPSASGYWMVGLDGGVFTFGDAAFHGSAG